MMIDSSVIDASPFPDVEASSPLTQTFGLGLFDRFGPREFDEIEECFLQRGADVFH